MESDPRRHAPATERNRQPILEVLERVLPDPCLVLEIASGTGQHAAWLSERLPGRTWQPSDADPPALAGIDAWCAESRGDVRRAVRLDVHDEAWPVPAAGAIVCVNMIHISPWSATPALFRGATRVLPPAGVLYLYGPYRRGGQHTAPSNETFDASLRAQNPEWGVRDLEEVVACAEGAGFSLSEVVAMPANNLSVLLLKR
jgi:SAM-dependent methyltransferase